MESALYITGVKAFWLAVSQIGVGKGNHGFDQIRIHATH